MFSEFFLQAFVYLLAAIIAVPLARRLGLGSALGYILAGVIIGPYLLGFVGDEGQDVMHFAEFGVVLMLFLVGLELEPPVLWRMRVPILGMGGSQVLVSTVAIGAVALAFGLPWQTALAIGLILSLSSTAIVLQTMKEKGWMGTQSGRGGFGASVPGCRGDSHTCYPAVPGPARIGRTGRIGDRSRAARNSP